MKSEELKKLTDVIDNLLDFEDLDDIQRLPVFLRLQTGSDKNNEGEGAGIVKPKEDQRNNTRINNVSIKIRRLITDLLGGKVDFNKVKLGFLL